MRSTIPRLLLHLLPGLVVIFAGACGSDSPTETDESSRVANVQIRGLPDGPILVDSSVQLTATPRNLSGTVVSGRPITWSSSDPSIAKVTTTGVMTALYAGVATIRAECDGARDSVMLDVRDGGVLGPSGGTLTVLDSTVVLSLPPGALPEVTTLLFRPVVDERLDTLGVAGSAFEVTPQFLDLASAGTLTVRYDPTKLAPHTTEPALQLYTYSNREWRGLPGSTVDPAAHTVTGTFLRGGNFAVAATLADRISIGGDLAGGALYIGHSGKLTGIAYDVHGGVMATRSPTWTTSDAGIARIDGTGVVTAVSTGTVTITATMDEQSASTTVMVLEVPVPSWSQTTEWSTFQGNARHTGAIAATLAPNDFHEIWTAAGVRGPVTLGDGNVYGISNGSVAALDAGTGTQRWTYDLGSRESYDPPAFGNGTVYVQTGGSENSFVWAISATDGSLRWRSAYDNQWFSWFAPTVVGQVVYAPAGYSGGMVAYDATTGASLWSIPLNQYDMWTPAVADGLVYAYTGDYSPKVSVVDAATGTVSYEIPDPGFTWRGWSMNLAPVLGTQNDIIAQPGTRLVSFDLANRTVRWQVAGWVSTPGGPWQATVDGGVVYAFNGNQVEARRETDGTLLWNWPLPANGTQIGTMIATDNLLFVSATAAGSDVGATYALDIASHRLVWSYPAGGLLAMGANGVLYIASSDRLTAVAVR